MQSNVFVPVLTTDAGSALTVADWQKINVQTVCYHLSTLLIKPGMPVLERSSSLAAYVGWQGVTVLNAYDLNYRRDHYEIRSPYDGSVHRYTSESIIALVAHLKPSVFIPPKGMSSHAWRELSTIIRCVVATEDLPNVLEDIELAGVFIAYDENTMNFDKLKSLCASVNPYPCYVVGNMSYARLCELIEQNMVHWLESNQPAQDGLQGLVYGADSCVDITEPGMEMAFYGLSQHCQCEACTHGLTHAYFHHLYTQTPGLCQRFLIQHNVSLVNQMVVE